MNLRGYALSIWALFDPIYYMFTRLTYLDKSGSEENQCVLRVRITRYKGRPVTLEDGTKYEKNDLLIKIHLHNVRLLREMNSLKSEWQKAIYIYKQVQNSLPHVAAYLENHTESEKIKGIIGITMLNSGCKRLGFETHAIQSKSYRLYKLTSLFPIHVLSNGKKSFINVPEPLYLLMSKSRLTNRYSPS